MPTWTLRARSRTHQGLAPGAPRARTACSTLQLWPSPAASLVGHGSPSVDTSSVVTVPKPATPSRLSFFMRQQSASGAEGLGAVPRSPGLASPASSPGHRPPRWEEVAELDGNYLEYLRDARLSVDRCAWACRVWSAPYDGERPGPDSLAPTPAPALPISPDHFGHGPPTPRTKKRGLPEEAGGSSAGPGDSRPLPAPDAQDPGALVNGAPESGRPGGGAEGAVTVKKVRRCPQAEREALPTENGAPQPPAPGWEGPSVDSLLDELLARAPAEPNGAGLSIESFSEELQELEAAMRNGGGGPPRAQLPPPHAEEDEAEDEDEAFAAPPRPADPLAQVLASPPRALGPPPSQPFTGETPCLVAETGMGCWVLTRLGRGGKHFPVRAGRLWSRCQGWVWTPSRQGFKERLAGHWSGMI